MSIIETQAGLMEALSGDMTPKFMATRSADGIPNVVPVTSIMPAGDVEDRLIIWQLLAAQVGGQSEQRPARGRTGHHH